MDSSEQEKSTVDKVLNSLNVLFDMLGFIAFGAVVLATLRQKKLHGSSCHRLIGIYSFCCLASKLVFLLPYGLTMFTVQHTVPYFVCCLVQLLPMSLAMGSFTLMLAIGADRLFSLLFPIWYKLKRKSLYLIFVAILCPSYPFYIAFLIIHNAIVQPNQPSNCGMFEFTAVRNPQIVNINTGLNLATLLCYILITARIIYLRYKGETSAMHQSLFKSLALIVLIQLGGWMVVNVGYSMIGSLQGVGPEQKTLALGVVNCFISVATSSEVLVLYFTSSDHRSALRREIREFRRLFSGPGNSVSNMANTNINNNNIITTVVMGCPKVDKRVSTTMFNLNVNPKPVKAGQQQMLNVNTFQKI